MKSLIFTSFSKNIWFNVLDNGSLENPQTKILSGKKFSLPEKIFFQMGISLGMAEIFFTQLVFCEDKRGIHYKN